MRGLGEILSASNAGHTGSQNERTIAKEQIERLEIDSAAPSESRQRTGRRIWRVLRVATGRPPIPTEPESIREQTGCGEPISQR